jgi:hypothetical protein
MGKLAKGFSDREVVVDLGPDYDTMEENLLEGMQVAGCQCLMNLSVGAI